MRKKVGIIKRLFCLLLIFLLSINSFAAIVSDNDGSAFITKAEFDALKSSFQSQIDSYNQSIDSKIDGAIASYLAGIQLATRMNIEPIISCSATSPYKVVGNTYDSRTTPILPSFNFSSVRMHQLGGADARPFRRYWYTYANGTQTKIPSWMTDTAVGDWSSWATDSVKTFTSALGTWNDQNVNVCFELDDADPQLITRKCNEKLTINGSIVLWSNGWNSEKCFHGYSFADKILDNRPLDVVIDLAKNFRALTTFDKCQTEGLFDVFNDGKCHEGNPTDFEDKIKPWLLSDTRKTWTSKPNNFTLYCTTTSGSTDVYKFNTSLARTAIDHADNDLKYTYLDCQAVDLYLHKASDNITEVFDDTYEDANAMKKYYFGNLDDRKMMYLAWGWPVDEATMTANDIYDALKWPRVKIKNSAGTTTSLKNYYNDKLTYKANSTDKHVHFYGGFPLFVADKAYKKVTITLTEKKGTATGSNGRVWLKKGEFLNGSDLSASPWTAAERNNLYKINGAAVTSSTNYGYNIPFNTPTQLVLNDIAAGEEVFLRFADSSNGTGCLIDSIQIEAEFEN